MIKKITWVIVLVAVAWFVTWSNDPINDTANFIIAGSIPGTSLSIGLWSTLLLSALLFWLVWLGIKHANLQMLEHTAQQIKKDQAETDFHESTGFTFDTTKRSVIAAPSQD